MLAMLTRRARTLFKQEGKDYNRFEANAFHFFPSRLNKVGALWVSIASISSLFSKPVASEDSAVSA